MRLVPFLLAFLAAAPAVSGEPDVCEMLSIAKTAPQPLAQGTCNALAAVDASDRAALSALMADDFIMTTASGAFLSGAKAKLVERWAAAAEPGVVQRSTLRRIESQRLFGDAGVIVGAIEDSAVSAAGAECTRHAFTDVWERRDGKWVWTVSHESGVSACRSAP